MATGNLLGPQPDLDIIATEVLKVANIPAFADGQQILAELRAIREQSTRDSTAIREQSTRDNAAIRQDIAAIRQDIAAIHQDIASLRQDLMTTITASNHNGTARVQNTYVASRAEPLSPFLNLSNGAAIPEFPATSIEIGQMVGRQIDTVLRQLGLQPAHGTNLAAKKKMLRAHIGLREVAAEAP